MKHLLILGVPIPMGRRPSIRNNRHLHQTRAAIYLWKHDNRRFSWGIELLWPDHGCHFFAEDSQIFDPIRLLRAAYAASKITIVSAEVAAMSIFIANSKDPLFDDWPIDMVGRFDTMYRTPEDLRQEVLRQEITAHDYNNLLADFKAHTPRFYLFKDRARRILKFIIRD